MGFFDKVKKALGSKKEDVESQNNGKNIENDEITDKSTPNDKIRNFKYLDDLIHSGAEEIVLDSDIVLGSYESQYLEGIRLDVDDLIIDGNGHTIDAKGKARIFYSKGNVIIKNIVLKNGYAKEQGGAIYNLGELIIHNSVLKQNTAQGTELHNGGGAIYNNEGSLTITRSTLTENTAQNDGGAIYNYKAETTITGSTLTSNHTTQIRYFLGSGGAIHNDYRGELTIHDSTLAENSADCGGAINNCNGGELTITDSTIVENTAKRADGGAIRNWGGELTITDSTIVENTAKENGGAIHNDYRGELTITDSTIVENTAKENGGAILNREGNFKIFNCEFLSNKTSNNIILNNDHLQIHNTIFSNNQSKFIILNDREWANLGIFN